MNLHKIYNDAVDPLPAKVEEVEKSRQAKEDAIELAAWEAWRSLAQTQKFLELLKQAANQLAFGNYIGEEKSIGVALGALLSPAVTNEIIRARLCEIATIQKVLSASVNGKY